MSNDTLACTYAALICHDAGVATTAENIEKVVKSAGLEVNNVIPILFARFLEKKSITSLFEAAASTAAPAPAAAAPAAGAAAPAAGKKAAAPVEEEEDDEMGLDLFG
jgi:large subunit ribosomal protein LP1